MKNYKKVIALLLTLTMSLSLGACGKKTSDNAQPATATKGESTTATNSNELKGKFSIFHFMEENGAGTSKAFWTEAKKYQSDNPGVNIDYQFTDSDNYEEKLTTLMAGNELSDVFLVKGDMLGTLADANMIVPLDQYISADPDWASSYVDGAFSDCTYNGKQWGAPFQMQANCVGFYNEAIFKECGIAGWPETWDELLSDCEKIKAKGYTPIAVGNKDQWLAESVIFNTYAYKYLDGNWFDSLKNNKGAKFTDAKFVEALTNFKVMFDKGYVNQDVNSINADEMLSLYYNKKAAMLFDGAWGIGTIAQNAPKDVTSNTHLGLMPTVTGQSGTKFDTAAGAGWNYVVKAGLNEEDLNAALAFLKQVTTGDYADQALLNGFFSAANPSGSVDDSKLDPLFAEYSKLESTMNFLPIFDCQLPAEIGSGVLFADTQKLISGTITPEDMATECQKTMENNY